MKILNRDGLKASSKPKSTPFKTAAPTNITPRVSTTALANLPEVAIQKPIQKLTKGIVQQPKQPDGQKTPITATTDSYIHIEFKKDRDSLNSLRREFKSKLNKKAVYVRVTHGDRIKGTRFEQLIGLSLRDYPSPKDRFDIEAISASAPLRFYDNHQHCIQVLSHGTELRWDEQVDIHIPIPTLSGECQLGVTATGDITFYHAPANLELKVKTTGDFKNKGEFGYKTDAKFSRLEVVAKNMENENTLSTHALKVHCSGNFRNISNVVVVKESTIDCGKSITNEAGAKMDFDSSLTLAAPVVYSHGALNGVPPNKITESLLKIAAKTVVHTATDAKMSALGIEIEGTDLTLLSTLSSAKDLVIQHPGWKESAPAFEIVVSESAAGGRKYSVRQPGVEGKPSLVEFSDNSLKPGQSVEVNIPTLTGDLKFSLNAAGDFELLCAPLDLNLTLNTPGNFKNSVNAECEKLDISAKKFKNTGTIVLGKKSIIHCSESITNEAGAKIDFESSLTLVVPVVYSHGALNGVSREKTTESLLTIEAKTVIHTGTGAKMSAALGIEIEGGDLQLLSEMESEKNIHIKHQGDHSSLNYGTDNLKAKGAVDFHFMGTIETIDKPCYNRWGSLCFRKSTDGFTHSSTPLTFLADQTAKGNVIVKDCGLVTVGSEEKEVTLEAETGDLSIESAALDLRKGCLLSEEEMTLKASDKITLGKNDAERETAIESGGSIRIEAGGEVVLDSLRLVSGGNFNVKASSLDNISSDINIEKDAFLEVAVAKNRFLVDKKAGGYRVAWKGWNCHHHYKTQYESMEARSKPAKMQVGGKLCYTGSLEVFGSQVSCQSLESLGGELPKQEHFVPYTDYVESSLCGHKKLRKAWWVHNGYRVRGTPVLAAVSTASHIKTTAEKVDISGILSAFSMDINMVHQRHLPVPEVDANGVAISADSADAPSVFKNLGPMEDQNYKTINLLTDYCKTTPLYKVSRGKDPVFKSIRRDPRSQGREKMGSRMILGNEGLSYNTKGLKRLLTRKQEEEGLTNLMMDQIHRHFLSEDLNNSKKILAYLEKNTLRYSQERQKLVVDKIETPLVNVSDNSASIVSKTPDFLNGTFSLENPCIADVVVNVMCKDGETEERLWPVVFLPKALHNPKLSNRQGAFFGLGDVRLKSSGELFVYGNILSQAGDATLIANDKVVVMADIEATNILLESITSDVHFKSTVHREGGQENFQDVLDRARAVASQVLCILAGKDVIFEAAETGSGLQTYIEALHNILDIPVETVSQKIQHFHGKKRGTLTEVSVQQQTSHHQSGGDGTGMIEMKAGDSSILYAPTVEADSLTVVSANTSAILNVTNTFQSLAESVERKSNHRRIIRQSQQNITRSSGSQLNVKHLSVEGGQKIILRQIQSAALDNHFRSSEVSMEQGKNTFSAVSQRQSSDLYWQSSHSSSSSQTTYTPCHIPGVIEIQALRVNLEAVPGKALDFARRIQTSGDIEYKWLTEQYTYEAHSAQGPSAGLAIVTSLAVGIATMGTGSALAAAKFGFAVGGLGNAVVAAGFSTLCSQAAVALLSSEGDPFKAIVSLGSTEAIKSLAISMVTAGAMHEIGAALKLPKGLDQKTFLQHAEYHLARASVTATLNVAVNGQSVEDAVSRGIVDAAVGTVSGVAGEKIGALYSHEQMNGVTHKLLHTFVGAATGAVVDGKNGIISGVLGGLVASIAADMIKPDTSAAEQTVKEIEQEKGAPLTANELQTVYKAEGEVYQNALDKAGEVSKLAAGVVSLATNQSVATTVQTAGQTVDNDAKLRHMAGFDKEKTAKVNNTKAREAALKAAKEKAAEEAVKRAAERVRAERIRKARLEAEKLAAEKAAKEWKGKGPLKREAEDTNLSLRFDVTKKDIFASEDSASRTYETPVGDRAVEVLAGGLRFALGIGDAQAEELHPWQEITGSGKTSDLKSVLVGPTASLLHDNNNFRPWQRVGVDFEKIAPAVENTSRSEGNGASDLHSEGIEVNVLKMALRAALGDRSPEILAQQQANRQNAPVWNAIFQGISEGHEIMDESFFKPIRQAKGFLERGSEVCDMMARRYEIDVVPGGPFPVHHRYGTVLLDAGLSLVPDTRLQLAADIILMPGMNVALTSEKIAKPIVKMLETFKLKKPGISFGSEPFSEVVLVNKTLETIGNKVPSQAVPKPLIFSDGVGGASSSTARARPVPAQKAAPTAGSSSSGRGVGGGEPSQLRMYDSARNNASRPDAAAKRSINRKAEQITKQGYQKHHIISNTNKLTQDHPLFKLAGVDMDSWANKMFLPAREGLHPTRSIHHGRHVEALSKRMADEMNKVVARGARESWSQVRYERELRTLIGTERKNLVNGETALNARHIVRETLGGSTYGKKQ